MESWQTRALLGAGVTALWLNGRYWRGRWDAIPKTRLVRGPDKETDTAIVVFVGAFNSADHVVAGLLPVFEQYGDVLLVEYGLKRFNMQKTVEAAFDVLPLQYEKVILIGGSMGGIAALQFPLLSNRYLREETVAIGADTALCAGHLIWAARLARFVHPGPIFNQLSHLTARLMFRVMPEELWSEGTEEETVRAHVVAMRRYRLSSILDQVAAIAGNKLVTREQMLGIRAAYLRSGTDAVIKADKAALSWKFIFPESIVIDVPDGAHVTWVEHASSWRKAFQEAFDRLGVRPA